MFNKQLCVRLHVAAILLFLISATCVALAIDLTRSAVPSAPSPPARLADLAWLAGSWEGDGIGGGKALEVYSPAAGGQMVGHFTQLNPDGSVVFYEIISITEKDGTLHYRLKHFHPDLTGWEEKDVVRDFPLVALELEKDTWYFDDLTVKRDGTNGMVEAVRVRKKDGTSVEYSFHYTRKGPQ